MKTAHFIKKPLTYSQDLSSAALSSTTSQTRKFKLEEVTLKADQAISETVTITRVSANGTAYDHVLAKRVMVAERDFVFRPQGECNFYDGENLKVECTNANSVGTVSGEIKLSEM